MRLDRKKIIAIVLGLAGCYLLAGCMAFFDRHPETAQARGRGPGTPDPGTLTPEP